MGIRQGNYGGTTTTTEPQPRGAGTSILQGAALGLDLGSALFPGGGLLGAGLGAFLGSL